MTAPEDFLSRLRGGALTVRDCCAVLAASFALLLALYSGAFRAGFYAEDFAWLVWSREHSFLDVWSAPGGTYFRPLSVRLPYWLFPRLPLGGHLLWKLTAFCLIGGASYFLWRWLDLLTGRRALALFLAVAWMHSPFQCFPLYYVNALDYAVFPFALLGFLLAVERSRWGSAFAWLWLGLLAKEWALAFPMLAFLLKRVPAKVLVGMLVSLPVFALWSGLFTAGGSLAGFAPHENPAKAIDSLSFFLSRTFLPGFVIKPLFAWGWFASAALILLAGFAGLFRSFQRLLALRLAAAAATLYVPLFFFANVRSEFLGGAIWIFLFPIACVGLGALAGTLARPARIAFFALQGALLLFYLPAERLETVRKFAAFAHVFDFALDRALLFAGNCEEGHKIAWAGMENLVIDQESAEHVIWGMRWKFPGREFFLVKGAGFEEKKVIPAHQGFWIERSEAKNMLVLDTLKTPRGVQVFSLGGGVPGCGIPGGKNTLGPTFKN